MSLCPLVDCQATSLSLAEVVYVEPAHPHAVLLQLEEVEAHVASC